MALLFFPTQNVTFEGEGKSGALSWYFSSSGTHSAQKGSAVNRGRGKGDHLISLYHWLWLEKDT